MGGVRVAPCQPAHCVRPSPPQFSSPSPPNPPLLPSPPDPGVCVADKKGGGGVWAAAARSRHDAVCLSGSKGPDVGRGGVGWGEGSPPPPHLPALCVPPPHPTSPHLSSAQLSSAQPPLQEASLWGLQCSAWSEYKDQGGRWPFETTHSQHTPLRYTHTHTHTPQLRPVSPAQYNIAAVVCAGGGAVLGLGVPLFWPCRGKVLSLCCVKPH